MADIPQQVSNWLNKPTIVIDHVMTVEKGLWTNFCISVEDENPLYWDYPTSRHVTGSVIAPPAMLPSWAIQHDWFPGKTGPGLRTLELHFMVKDALGYKNGLVIDVDLEFHEPLKEGDSVRAEQVLRSISDERQTKLGLGRNWTIEVIYRKPDGSLAGTQTLRFLGYGRIDQ